MNLEQIDTSTTAGKAEVMRLAGGYRKEVTCNRFGDVFARVFAPDGRDVGFRHFNINDYYPWHSLFRDVGKVDPKALEKNLTRGRAWADDYLSVCRDGEVK